MMLDPLSQLNPRRSLTPEDRGLLNQLQKITQAPDALKFDVKTLLFVVDNIRHCIGAISTIPSNVVQGDKSGDEETLQNGFDDIQDLAEEIQRLSREISYIVFWDVESQNVHEKTLKIFNKLSSYSWETKVVLALAAFAANYGVLGLAAELYSDNLFAEAIVLFKQLPDVLEEPANIANKSTSSPKLKSEEVTDLVKTMLDVTKCIVEFSEKPSGDDDDMAEISAATSRMLVSVYWTIRSVVEIIPITAPLGPKQKPSQRSICNMHEKLMRQLNLLGDQQIGQKPSAKEKETTVDKGKGQYRFQVKIGKSWSATALQKLCMKLPATMGQSDEKMQIKASQTLSDARRTDNIKVLKGLFNTKKNQLPLFDGSTKKSASIEKLRRKNVLLLITDIEFSLKQDLPFLSEIYTEACQQSKRSGGNQYEAVWLPIMSGSSTSLDDEKQKQFQERQASMPWCSVYDPSMLNPAFIKYVEHVWHFDMKPLVVVLDPQGRVVNTNALHMMRIWGGHAFPFTRLKEEELWNNEAWVIGLLLHSIGPMVSNWIIEGKCICLYGGRDIEWIEKLKSKAQEVASAADIPQIQMLYVGRRNPGERVKKINTSIAGTTNHEDRLKHALLDLTSIAAFWVRLESMWHSKMQVGKSPENDAIMRGIMLLFDFDCSNQGWALFNNSALSPEMAMAKGDTILKSLAEYESWKGLAEKNGFVVALAEQLHQLSTALYYHNNLVLPAGDNNTVAVAKRVPCSECSSPMERLIMYHCTTDNITKQN